MPGKRESIVVERCTAKLVVHPYGWLQLGDLANDNGRGYDVVFLHDRDLFDRYVQSKRPFKSESK